MSNQTLTPMLRQYLEIKSEHPDSLLFFRLGDFYEMFFEDAKIAAKILDITLTSRNKGDENAVPLCGVPYHAASSYIARLITAGHRVAICEQMEEAQAGKGIVKREVVRVITKGTVLETESLDAKQNSYIASIAFHARHFTVCYIDVSTGEMKMGLFENPEDFLSLLHRLDPKEILYVQEERSHPLFERVQKELQNSCFWPKENPKNLSALLSRFSESFQKSWEQAKAHPFFKELERPALRLLFYVQETLKRDIMHLHAIGWMTLNSHLILDAATVRHLELIRNLNDATSFATLFSVLDQTETAFGARRLKHWLLAPLKDKSEIISRQDGIEELHEKPQILKKLKTLLNSIIDLERLNARTATGIVNARELRAIGLSLALWPEIERCTEDLETNFFRKNSLDKNRKETLKNLSKKIVSTLREDAGLTLKEGGLIADQVCVELDELRDLATSGQKTLASLEEKERVRTGISSLKVRYNRVFGYYIEVPNSRREAVPNDYIRKQTLVNAERYITPEIKTYEEKVLGAQARIRELEYQIFSDLRFEVAAAATEIAKLADCIANLDAIASLAAVALENNYTRPTFSDESILEIEEGRHPVLESLKRAGPFVPNDLSLGHADCRLILLTGPNMAGKSTLLRQTALIALMAHMGSYVPAKSLRLGLIDRIFTRIGASDQLSKNQSTFWVEMEETAMILKNATSKSLIILDEIGRGTSTHDGLSVAWAVSEFIHDTLGAKALFATHYHELVALEENKSGIRNFHIAVKEWEGKILFLYRMLPGGISQSYGIQVAELAGLPPRLIKRAKEILQSLQDGAMPETSLEKTIEQKSMQAFQHSLFETKEKQVINELESLNLLEMTPIQALTQIQKWKEAIGNK